MNIKPRVGERIAAVILASFLALPAAADAPRRVASINLCTDQLLLALGEPSQIAALGRFSRNAEMSFLATRALRYPALRGSAEEVLHARPDLVLAGTYSGRATREILMGHGVVLETFAPPRSIEEAKAEIERAGRLLGASRRAGDLLATIDAAIADAARSAPRPDAAPIALALQRRAYASGKDTLLSAAMEAAGFRNAAVELGIVGVGHVPLERFAKLKLDALIVEDLPVSSDQSSAILQHPVLRARRDVQIVKVPVAEVTCGGPSLASLIRRLSAAVR